MTQTETTSSMMALAEAVASNIDIAEVCLLETNAVRPWGTKLKSEVRAGHKAETTFDAAKHRILVKVFFSLDASAEGAAEDAPPVLQIRACFGLHYSLKSPKEYTDDETKAFGDINGVFNAWPFWREYVYSTLARMGLPPLTLPVYRIGEVKPETKS